MRFAFYCCVLLVAVASVVFGLDWMSAPMPPMPDAKNVVFVPPPPPPPRVAQPVSPPPASPVPAPATVAAAPRVETAPAPPPIVAAPKPKCDIEACAAAYRSFRESDCTFNPSVGPRQLCTKGDPAKYAKEAPAAAAPLAAPPPAVPPAPAAEQPASIVAPEPGSIAAPEPAAASPVRCNVSACAAAYRSFRESDCTFNPSSGPRRLCEK